MEENNYYVAGEAAGNEMIRKVYLWMCGALAVTGLVAYYIANSAAYLVAAATHPFLLWGPMVAELVLVIVLTSRIDRMSSLTATLMFLGYSVLNGVTLSSIFLVYDLGSIATTFAVCACTFGVMALYGAVTRKDLTRIGNIALMALIGLIIASVVNLFLHNTMFDMIISAVGVLLFVGLTAYDAQRIRVLLAGEEYGEETAKMAVIGALQLYLDFVNLFLYLLRFMGRRN